MADIPTIAWNENTPADGDNAADGDDRIREMKTQVREVMDVDHDFPSSGKAADVGQHKVITLQKQGADPGGTTDVLKIYQKDVSGDTELFVQDDVGNVIQITNAGALEANAVLLTGAQTVAGLKTLTTIPRIPEDDPTHDAEVVSLGFLDDHKESDPIDHAAASIGTAALAANAVTASDTDVGADAISNTSGDWADMADMAVTVTLIANNDPVLICFNATIYTSAAGNNIDFQLLRGATTIHNWRFVGQGGSINRLPVGITFLDVGASLGANTYKVQWKDTTGTAYQDGVNQPRAMSALIMKK